MIDRKQLLADCQDLVEMLVDDLRQRTDEVDEIRSFVRGEYARAESAGRTDRAYEDWREDILAQVAVGWVLATVFVRFIEDNELVDAPLLSGPGQRRDLARDHRTHWLGNHPALGDREWLIEVFDRTAKLPAVHELLGERNPLRLFGPSADGARTVLELWWRQEDDGSLRHDFRDPSWDTRFLGDLYQDLSEHAKDTYALLQTPEFVEEFILDYTLNPAIETFGLEQFRIIDPTCGSGHFLLGSFDRLFTLWKKREPGTNPRALAQRVLDAVNGVDVNPFAAAIARFRLLIAALKHSHVDFLAEAPDFKINVAVGDSLLHGTAVQLTLTRDESDPLTRHRYPTEDGQLADKLLQPGRYHAVVGNPPYITVRDKALSDAYRERYSACYRQYSLAVPFMQRFFRLAKGTAEGAGFVGMITANSFMKREFGKKVVEEYLANEVDLSHIVDTSGAFIPGHNTPTVILFGRNRRPIEEVVRAVLGIRGEPEEPEDPAQAEVWSSILDQIEEPGSESDYVSVEDAARSRFTSHPWSLQGGAAPEVFSRIEANATSRLESYVVALGRTTVVGEDDAWVAPSVRDLRRRGVDISVADFVTGSAVRDWRISDVPVVIYPYQTWGGEPVGSDNVTVQRVLWPLRAVLARRTVFGKTFEDRGLPWWVHLEQYEDKLSTPLSIAFAEVATHNHFVLDRGGKLFKQTAPVIKLADSYGEDFHLKLLAVLNSSVGEFWMNQVYQAKGGDQVGQSGARVSKSRWEDRYQRDGTKLQQFPLPKAMSIMQAGQLDGLADRLNEVINGALDGRTTPTASALESAAATVRSLRGRMVAEQEELDWSCYVSYGLLDEDLNVSSDELPDLAKGERAFEIVLARRMVEEGVDTTWFARHGSEPITECPPHWPKEYRDIVERRIALIESDRTIGLLERPEYKRRWNWTDWTHLQRDALRAWLLGRLESGQLWPDPTVATSARLAGRLQGDEEFMEVARIYAGDADVDGVIERLLLDEAVPFLAAYRYQKKGFTKRKVWEDVWRLQRLEDEIDARMDLPAGHPEHLTEEDAALLKKEQVGKIPVPPKYRTGDFANSTYWSLRGNLDVAKERFILYPNTRIGADTSPVIGWAGWDHLEQARALSGHYTQRKSEGAEPAELVPLLAGIHELVPWLLQWHNEPDPEYGERLGEFFESFVDTEARALGTTTEDLAAWRPS